MLCAYLFLDLIKMQTPFISMRVYLILYKVCLATIGVLRFLCVNFGWRIFYLWRLVKMKKILSLVLTFVFVLCIVFSLDMNVSADDTIIQQHIDTLYKLLGNTYFTVDRTGVNCGAKQTGVSHSCSNCYTENIVKASWFVNMFGNCSTSNFPKGAGWSCLGFAHFAEWYIFKSSNNEKITVTDIGTYDFNYQNILNYVKIGDELRLDSAHSVIFISADTNGVYVLDSNWSRNNIKKYYAQTS